MKKQDSLQKFIFEHANIRGEIVYLNESYKTILAQRNYPIPVQSLLGEAMAACLLLVGSLKFEGEVSLQFHGDNRLPLLLVQCDHQLQIRAFAKYDADNQDVDYGDAFLNGNMALIINPYHQTQAYESIVPIQSTSLADNLMLYFSQSEQISTKVWLAVKNDQAAGMLLQLMPNSKHVTHDKEQFWEYAVQIGETITADELLSLDNATILYRLYHETELRLYPERPVRFACRCSAEKMQQVLTVLGREEMDSLLKEKGKIDISCDFCQQKFVFDAIDIELLFRKK